MPRTVRDGAHVKEIVRERTLTAKLFGESSGRYIALSAEINSIREDILNNEFPRYSVEDLVKLRSDLSSKYSIFKSQIKHSQLMFSSLLNEIHAIDDFNSKETFNNRKAVIMKNLMLTKKRTEELTKKKREIQDLNQIIDSFKRPEYFDYTEEEISEIFGPENLEKIKNVVVKVFVKEKRPKKQESVDKDGDIKVDSDTDKPLAKDANGKAGPQEEEYEEVDVAKYRFKADISKPVSELNKIQSTLIASLEQYELEIAELKRGYIERVIKFEAMMSILKGGAGDDQDEQMADKEEQNEETEIRDDDGESDRDDYNEGDEARADEEQHQNQGDDDDDDEVDEEELYNDKD